MNVLLRYSLSACAAFGLMTGVANAAHRHADERGESSAPASPCYDPGDASEIRLWDGPAPGAIGDDPCRDIPFLKIYRASDRSASTRTAIIVMPGGGYDRLSDQQEQAPVGEYFSQKLHVTTFVLFYRLVQTDGSYRYPTPMWDAQRAIKLARYRAAQYGFDPHRLGVFGFSAGGHLAATVTLHADSRFELSTRDPIDDTDGRPDFLGLGYPVISMLPDEYASPSSLNHLLHGYQGAERQRLEQQLSAQHHVTPGMPPVFLFESMDDARISPQNSVLFANALAQARVPNEVHLFAHGKHGAGLAQDLPEEAAWPGLFGDWLGKLGLVK